MVEIAGENTSGPEYVKRFAKQMLKNSIFIGTFHEKRFVESLNAYRDVVCISGEETEFIENLMAVKKRIESEFTQFPWIGITGPLGIGTPTGYNLWVNLPVEVFGKYWFKVKAVDFLSNEIFLKLEVIRLISSENNSRNVSSNDLSNDLNFNISFEDMKLWAKEKIFYFYKHLLTTENIKTTVIFSSVLISTLVLSCVDIVKYLLEYLLKLINEFSKLIHTLTPIIINVINLCGRAIFGLFHLIATLFKSHPPAQPIYNAYVNYDPVNGMPTSFVFDKPFPKALPDIQRRSRATIQNLY